MSKHDFFRKMERLGIALTFDDVRLRTGHSIVMPDGVDLESKFSRNIGLKIPLVSAPMDTVTEHKLAIELAKLGGLGIIHKNMTPEQQADEVAKVKFHLNGLIKKPICVYENQTIEEILKLIEEKKYSFNTFPVLNEKNKLVGVLTKNDFDFCDDGKRYANEIMTKGAITGRKGTTLKQAYKIMKEQKKKTLPLIDKYGSIVGLYIFSDLKRILKGNFLNYNVDKNHQLMVGAAVGVGKEALNRVEKLLEENVDVIVIDTAHADTISVIKTLRQIKRSHPSLDVVVGNISEPSSAKRLLDNGADGIKIGQGPGSICTTRIIAGIGMPQVTAVYGCSLVADKYKVPLCADGGIVHSGDIPVAIGAGAYSVMCGNIFAGTKEAPGTIVFKDGRQWKEYRGMGSIGAMTEHKGSRERYLQSETGKSGLIAEGVEGMVPYKGELSEVVHQYVGGLRRGMGYVGAENIEKLRKKADFFMISSAGKTESHPHDIFITREPPNYPLRGELK